MSINNIRRVFQLVDALDYKEGVTAYQRYHDLMQDFANYYKAPLNNTVAAFVSLSPNNSWFNNLRSLVTVLDAVARGALPDEITTSTYNACKIRAYNYLTGAADFMLETKGPKIRSFFSNIMDPANPRPVTIDGHMISIWKGKKMTMVEASKTGCDYDDVARAVRRVAAEKMVLPCQLQATLWFTWKRIHNIVYDGQLNLFTSDDVWGILHRPEDVKPFTKREVPVFRGITPLSEVFAPNCLFA